MYMTASRTHSFQFFYLVGGVIIFQTRIVQPLQLCLIPCIVRTITHTPKVVKVSGLILKTEAHIINIMCSVCLLCTQIKSFKGINY